MKSNTSAESWNLEANCQAITFQILTNSTNCPLTSIVNFEGAVITRTALILSTTGACYKVAGRVIFFTKGELRCKQNGEARPESQGVSTPVEVQRISAELRCDAISTYISQVIKQLLGILFKYCLKTTKDFYCQINQMQVPKKWYRSNCLNILMTFCAYSVVEWTFLMSSLPLKLLTKFTSLIKNLRWKACNQDSRPKTSRKVH